MRRALTLRWLALCLFVVGPALVCGFSTRAWAGDPYLRWYTVKTPHFHIHYHGGLEHFAQRVATVAEAVHQTLVPALNWQPEQVTQVLLTDTSSRANGSANALPYNTVRMFVSAPGDMSALNDYDDWAFTLLMHEHTHVLHLDNVHGLPAVINAIFGKIQLPNQAQPRWIIEGIATALESRKTSAGRLRSTQFDMFMRANVLEDRMLRLDELSHNVRRHPGGSISYLYGSRFVDWILHTYGPDTFAAVATDYGQNLIPWGINRSIRRATGRTYPELYRGWKVALQQRYATQQRAVEKRGLREGQRLTQNGYVVAYPRFVPSVCGKTGSPAIQYFRNDGHTTNALYRQQLTSNQLATRGTPTLIARSGDTPHSFDPECGTLFSSTATTSRRYRFFDLFRQAPGTTSPRGYETGRRRLTIGRRARSPDASPDGRHIVYVTDRAGTTTLRLANLATNGDVSGERLLVNKRRYEQVFTPRFSPDGKRVAYSTWLEGGYRDIHIVDTHSGTITALMHDRALDQQPAWSADGKTLYFTSDRTGIANVYAYRLADRRLRQVTNVINGAYMPAPSPDGKVLVYVGYTSDGYDLFAMPLDDTRFLEALPYHDHRPEVSMPQLTKQWPVEPFQVWPTLRPYSYELDYGEGPFGNQLTFTTHGEDITGRHALSINAGLDFDAYQPQADVSYWYSGLLMDLSVSGFRSVVPRDYNVDDRTAVVRESVTGLSSGLGYWMPGEFDSHFAALSYSLNRFERRLPVRGYQDPYATVPAEPHRGQLGLIHLGYEYNNVEGSNFGISLERGFSFDLGLDYASEATVSDDTLVSVSGRIRSYNQLPWARHHVLALTVAGGAAGGSYPRQGFFSLGGYDQLPILDAYTSNLRQSAHKLRGFLPAQFRGRQFLLGQAEYRFPISYLERGISTLPIFVQTLAGNVFLDAGGAFNTFDYEAPEKVLHMGIGAELWADVTLGYNTTNMLRYGIARGLGPEAQGLVTYFVASSRF